MRLSLVSLIAIVSLWGCRVDQPRSASDAVTLMTAYGKQQHYEKAIKTGEDWLKNHPEDTSHERVLYEQIAILNLLKAASDYEHKEEWIRKAVAFYDKDLSVHQNTSVDITFFNVGHGFTRAGDLSSTDTCLYYRRAIKAFEEEVPLIQGDNVTVNGKTFPLAPLRQENGKALEEGRAKFAKAGCK